MPDRRAPTPLYERLNATPMAVRILDEWDGYQHIAAALVWDAVNEWDIEFFQSDWGRCCCGGIGLDATIIAEVLCGERDIGDCSDMLGGWQRTWREDVTRSADGQQRGLKFS